MRTATINIYKLNELSAEKFLHAHEEFLKQFSPTNEFDNYYAIVLSLTNLKQLFTVDSEGDICTTLRDNAFGREREHTLVENALDEDIQGMLPTPEQVRRYLRTYKLSIIKNEKGRNVTKGYISVGDILDGKANIITDVEFEKELASLFYKPYQRIYECADAVIDLLNIKYNMIANNIQSRKYFEDYCLKYGWEFTENGDIYSKS